MILDEFRILTEEDQVETLLRYGTEVARRSKDNKTILLFAMHDFYVEIYYSGSPRILRSFESISKLEPYLDQINIEEVL